MKTGMGSDRGLRTNENNGSVGVGKNAWGIDAIGLSYGNGRLSGLIAVDAEHKVWEGGVGEVGEIDVLGKIERATLRIDRKMKIIQGQHVEALNADFGEDGGSGGGANGT
jgi:hypothetical protein